MRRGLAQGLKGMGKKCFLNIGETQTNRAGKRLLASSSVILNDKSILKNYITVHMSLFLHI